MAQLEKKHDHTMTKGLKAFIFCIVMLAPFIAVAVECLFMIQNPNAPTNYTGTQQNVFYNALNNIGTQSIFNWTTNTGMYTTISSVCTGLEFGTSANTLAILLTYWIINTIIYIIFDIIIEMFIHLTHIFSR